MSDFEAYRDKLFADFAPYEVKPRAPTERPHWKAALAKAEPVVMQGMAPRSCAHCHMPIAGPYRLRGDRAYHGHEAIHNQVVCGAAYALDLGLDTFDGLCMTGRA